MQPLSGDQLPHLVTAIPGPASRAQVDVLARHECPAVTARRTRRAVSLGAADDDPFVWSDARGANVRDVDGNVFVDLTAGFAVALLGHAHPAVVAAVQDQVARLPHAMGDAWPDHARIALLDRLAQIAPPGLDVALLGLSGADAVDAAVKTAVVATGRPGVLAFDGGYHGLALGVLGLQGYKAAFTTPFAAVTHGFVRHVPFGCPRATLDDALADGSIGLVVVEPVQGRGGVRVPPDGWLAEVSEAAHAAGALVAHDEIQTGLGRTGTWWAAEADGVVPDLLCTGKALGGGMPLSACLGTRTVMEAWGASTGEALHTQTFLGHPVGCAAASAVLDTIASERIPERCAALGRTLTDRLTARGHAVQGRGAMLGVVTPHSLALCRALQRRGYIVLPAGQRAEVLCLTPPATLSDAQAQGFVDALDDALAEVTA
ncbi:MAG: aminotransferase class III-fold pyridoxal phosphate-dependent enzyme [Alphaproteobacteria bacterium]|nr:aminotransferase class III-fold pyridoxal phosphate-dependent enzyme [Alphaproteobacteria bacterium]